MSMLPFLNKNKVPKLRKLAGVSKYGFSEDDDMAENAINELIQAFESKDHKLAVSAIKALVEMVRNKQNAPEAQQDASGV